jgi:hypothetical protein
MAVEKIKLTIGNKSIILDKNDRTCRITLELLDSDNNRIKAIREEQMSIMEQLIPYIENAHQYIKDHQL